LFAGDEIEVATLMMELKTGNVLLTSRFLIIKENLWLLLKFGSGVDNKGGRKKLILFIQTGRPDKFFLFFRNYP
jgi:hypothetical protein